MTDQHPEFESAVDAFPVRLENFEGPLDLLLHLIKKNELGIHDIPIAFITQQYLDAIHLMQELNLDVAGEFLVMAATLIHIKSRMLLPRPDPTQEDPEEDPRDALMRRLLEHQKFKAAAGKAQFVSADHHRLVRSLDHNRHPGLDPRGETTGLMLHELAHAWQYEKGTGAKPPHHNQEFVARCEGCTRSCSVSSDLVSSLDICLDRSAAPVAAPLVESFDVFGWVVRQSERRGVVQHANGDRGAPHSSHRVSFGHRAVQVERTARNEGRYVDQRQTRWIGRVAVGDLERLSKDRQKPTPGIHDVKLVDGDPSSRIGFREVDSVR